LKPRKILESIPIYVGGKPIINKRTIKLNSNESAFNIPKKIIKKSLKSLKNLNRYHEPTGLFLREKIAEELKIIPENIILGNGSGEIIKIFIESFVESYEKIIIPQVTFSLYEIYSKLNGNTTIIKTNLTDGLDIDLNDILEKADNKTTIFIANPNNPTGKSYKYQDILQFLKKLPKETKVLLDEAYIEYSENYDPSIYRKLIEEFENLIIIRTFSKLGLAGLRIGYGISNSENIAQLNKVRPPFNTNILAQYIAYNLLEEKNFIKKLTNFVKKERENLFEKLKDINIKTFKSDANFILIQAKENLDKELEKRGILIRNAYSFGLSSDYYRITIGTKRENLKMIKALTEVLT